MTEVETVVGFLAGSGKGRLQYDRNWASSREGVDRVLTQLSSDINQINLEEPAVQQTETKPSENEDIAKLSPIRSQGEDTEPDTPTVAWLKDHLNVSRRSLGSPLATPNSLKKKLGLKDSLNDSRRSLGSQDTPTMVSRKAWFREELDESRRSAGSPADRSFGNLSPADRSLSNLSAADRSLLNLSSMSNRETASPVSGTPKRGSDSYFGVRPLRVMVNRSAERRLDKQLDIDSLASHSPIVSPIIEETDSPSFTQVKVCDSSVFHYSPGFLQRVSSSSVSVDVIKLKLDSVRHLLNMEQEEEDSSESEDEDDDDEVEASLEYDRKLAILRDELRVEADKKTAAVQQLFREKSRQLAVEAETRHRQEMAEHDREMKEEEQRILYQINREKLAVEREVAEEAAAEERRLDEMKEFLQSCRDQENKIREEAQKEVRVKQQRERMNSTLPGIKESIIALLELWESIKDKSKLSETSVNAMTIQKEFSDAIDNMKKLSNEGEATDEDWLNLANLDEKILNTKKTIEEDLQAIRQATELARKAELEAARAAETKAAEALKEAQLQQKKSQEALQQQQQQQQQQQEKEQQEQQQVPEVTQQAPQIHHPPAPSSPSLSYQEILAFKANYVKDVSFADTEKKVKSELTLAISTSLNAISAQTTEHLNDKLAKLTHLLAGRPVAFKDAQICAANHPAGIKFCMGMLAKKIVRQGEDVMSSKAEAAFSFASVALALWDTFPDFGKLLLAYFYEFCPQLAPYAPSRIEGQTDKEFYTSLGYKYDKDTIEKQDKYLKRMTGLSRLFAAIAASHKPTGSNPDHPMGPKTVWRFITGLMNIKPLPDVTATVLLVLLETTGNMMITQFKGQFYKLLVFIKQSFLPELEAVKTDGGPTARLDTFLQKVLAQKKIDAPKGILAPGFVKKVVL